MTDYQNPYEPTYVRTQIEAAYAKREQYRSIMEQSGWRANPLSADGPSGQPYWSGLPTPRELDFWMVQIIGRDSGWGALWTDEELATRNAIPGPAATGWSPTDGWYWEQRILFPWLYAVSSSADVTDTSTIDTSRIPQTVTTVVPDKAAVSASASAAVGITPQLGLLEDDILYNLALLATNVLQPLKRKYPNIVIVSGFRQVNTGLSQHEKGEAVDLQVRNQTPELLYEIADYIAKSLQFDQLILHYCDEPAISWIHVSFSATSLRRQVLTRNYDDSFLDGVHLITRLTGEAYAQAQRESAALLTRINAELEIEKARQNKLNPPVTIGDASPTTETTGGDGDGDTGAPGVVPDDRGIVAALFAATRDQYNFSSDDDCGRFTEAALAELRSKSAYGSQWGHLRKNAGQTQYAGHATDVLAFLGLPGDPEGVQYNGKTVTAVDFIVGAGSDTASPGWGVDMPRYTKNDWY